jgi:hypothetical protein
MRFNSNSIAAVSIVSFAELVLAADVASRFVSGAVGFWHPDIPKTIRDNTSKSAINSAFLFIDLLLFDLPEKATTLSSFSPVRLKLTGTALAITLFASTLNLNHSQRMIHHTAFRPLFFANPYANI